MKKLMLIVMLAMLVACGTKVPEKTEFSDFVALLQEVRQLSENRGYQDVKLVAQYTKFGYRFQAGRGALEIEYVNDVEDYFSIALYMSFPELNKLPEEVDIALIVDLVKMLSKKEFSSKDISEFLESDAYLDPHYNKELGFQVYKEKGNLETDDFLFSLEILNNNFGYFEISGLIENDISESYHYSSLIEKSLKKYKYSDYSVSHAEVYLINLNVTSEMSLIAYSSYESSLAAICFTDSFSLVYSSKLLSARDRVKNLDVDLFVEILAYFGNFDMDMILLHDFLLGTTGEFDIDELEEGFLIQRFYMSEDMSYMLNYELLNDFSEHLTYHYYGN